jgi:hypothetical protein
LDLGFSAEKIYRTHSKEGETFLNHGEFPAGEVYFSGES